MAKPKPDAKVPVREILESARAGVARTVNTTQVVANWLIGREIVEEEQNGQQRAAYGERLLLGLANRLRRDFGAGYSLPQLKNVRAFYVDTLTCWMQRKATQCGAFTSSICLRKRKCTRN